jgi:hypothetical protein
VPATRLSAANSLYTILQPLMLSLGICSGALILKFSVGVGGHAEPRLMDFSIAFAIVTLISPTSTRWHLKTDHDAGHELSGHRRR